MAKPKKPAKSSAKSKPAAKTTASRKPTGKSTLAEFYRKLWSKPALMEKFSSGAAGRDEVLAKSNLTPAHQKLVAGGCLRDVMKELVGVKNRALAETTVNNCVPDGGPVDCGHAECQAFVNAIKAK